MRNELNIIKNDSVLHVLTTEGSSSSSSRSGTEALCASVYERKRPLYQWYLQSCRHRLPGVSQRAPTWLWRSNSSSMWGSVTDCRENHGRLGRAGPSVWRSQSCRQGLDILYTLLWAGNQRVNMRSQILAGLSNLVFVMRDRSLLPPHLWKMLHFKCCTIVMFAVRWP